ncbi:TetR/AcrR family transcriptional regulator [Crossiella sp. CA198]|uniref:TetR/AcrR family transcriptional regulator n=1 Tax=Crossiella sp. CA198 TaxID=3455607 RepID=UPI003F8D85E9
MAGRPRDLDLEHRLLTAAWALLTSKGYDALTMTKVATQAEAHRSDVYRRWANKAELATDALAAHLPPVREFNAGSLHGDLRAYVDDLAAAWSAPWIDGLVGLLGELRDGAETRFLTMASGRILPLRNALDRAVQRGEIEVAPNVDLVADVIEGSLMHRRLIGRASFTPDYLDTITRTAHCLLTATTVTP